jgi:iron complex outermembrane receptor protein
MSVTSQTAANADREERMKRSTTFQMSVAAAALLGSSLPSHAQEETPDTAALRMNEVLVTARKRAENIQDVPISITAVSEESLKNQSINELIDLQRQVPGLQIGTGTASPTASVITIRGQGQADTLLTTDSSVGVYIDGVYNPRSLGLNSILQDVQRVEVLRGPQGTLFGRNTTGGALNVVTQSAGDELGGSIRAIYGENNTADLSGIVNLPLGDAAGLRLFARTSTRDGFATDAAGNDLNDEDLKFFRARLDFEPADNLTVSLTGDYGRIETGGAAIQMAGYQFGGTAHAEVAAQQCLCVPGLPQLFAVVPLMNSWVIDGGLDRTSGGQQQTSLAESWSTSGTVNWDVNDSLTVRSITGYRQLQKRDVEDLDGTPLLILEPDLRAQYDFLSQEFQLLGSSEKFNWVTGLYYSKEEGNDGSVTVALPFLNPANPNTFDADVENSSIAVFGQGTWQLADKWSLTGGLRWTEETKEMTSRNRLILNPFQGAPPIATSTGLCRIDPAQLDNPAICQASFSNDFSDWSWLAVLDYKITDNVMTYASASRGFRGGGQNLRGAPNTGSFNAYEPETALNYELGIKSSTADGRLVANGAIFMTDYQDIQRSIIVPGIPPVTRTGNAAAATLTGGELELLWNPVDPLTLSFSAAHLNGEYDEYIDTGDGLNRVNDPWPAPEWTYSASARYVVPMSIGDLAFQADYSHADAVSGVVAGTNPQLAPFLEGSDSNLLNGRISLGLDSIDGELALFGRNLTDEDYYTTRLNVLGVVTRYAGYPRFVGLELRLRFGGEKN